MHALPSPCSAGCKSSGPAFWARQAPLTRGRRRCRCPAQQTPACSTGENTTNMHQHNVVDVGSTPGMQSLCGSAMLRPTAEHTPCRGTWQPAASQPGSSCAQVGRCTTNMTCCAAYIHKAFKRRLEQLALWFQITAVTGRSCFRHSQHFSYLPTCT